MKQHWEKIPLSFRQFIKFCIVGVINTAIDTLTYYFFTRFLNVFYLTANVFAFIISTANSYYLNRNFTFQSVHEKKKLEYGKFIGIQLVGLAITEVILYLFVTYFGQEHDIIGKLSAVVVVLFWNFFGSKFFVFKIKK